MRISGKYIAILICTTLLLMACERDYLFRGDSRGLILSTDTLMFDTVFSSIGSATTTIKIYNPYNEDMTIETIELGNGDNSKFRLNINGKPTSILNEVRLRSKDSLYIFVEVTVDPSGSDAPFIVSDSIMIQTLERIQTIQLIAYGQDVVVLRKANLKTQTLRKGKPYLIYDYAIVDSLQQVTIEAGTKLHFHKDASLIVLGTLLSKGTMEEPIVLEGDRLEDFYSDKPGQWGFLQFLPGSKNNELHYTTIKNGIMGIRADSIGNGNEAPLIIANCRFEHISSVGLLAESSTILVYNTLFADCGMHSVALTLGGHYEFYHCTIANYYNEYFSTRNTPALLLNNYYYDDNKKMTIVPLRQALFANCIVHGRDNPEIGFDLKSTNSELAPLEINYLFDHSLIKIDTIKNNVKDTEKYINVITNKSPSFVSTEKYDYRLDTLSAAQNAGKKEYAVQYPLDILKQSRLQDAGPDLGIYERKEKK
jgi:hypothetical protein